MSFVRFVVGDYFSNRDIVDTVKCDERSYLRSAKDRGIVAVCLNKDENLVAPEEIWVGEGDGRARLATDFLSQCRRNPQKAVPVFVKDHEREKVEASCWQYLGRYRATKEEAGIFEITKRQLVGSPVVRVIYLGRVSD